MQSSNEDYKKAMQKDSKQYADYFLKHLHVKSEQQKFLEHLLQQDAPAHPATIGDIACGAGTLTHHISKIYPGADYYLIDINEEALKMADAALADLPRRQIIAGSVYDLSRWEEKFDLVFCWQTLSWLDKPELALDQLVKCCKKGGRIYLSSLFNLYHDVDVYSAVADYTRESAREGLTASYNTYSAYSVEKWLKGKVQSYRFHEFTPQIDFEYAGKGVGTYTVQTREGKRLQISGGMLMNWSVLEIRK